MEKNYKVLVVDDSPMIHILIKRALAPNGFIICGSAKNGREGLEKYKELSPDLVTMDITMPILDGLGAAKEIIKLNPQAKILMLSAIGDEETMEEAKVIGVKHFLRKPFNDINILEAANSIIENY